ncbi:MAG: hypothetical protein QOE35_507 [Actinomycetota bacterium]
MGGCGGQTCAVALRPETQYAKSGEVHIAYQVVGEGPLDLVFSPSPVSNLEVAWEWPPFERFLRRLASFSRLILFDKRGTGLSDRVTDAATLEERMDDVRAVMDAAGSERAAIFGSSEGGPMALLFTATYPERVSSLVLYGSYAKAINSDDYSSGVDAETFEVGMEMMVKDWGHGALIDVFAPSTHDDVAFRTWWGRYERQSASPGAAVAIQRLNAKLDVRPVLPSVRVPTLVLYRAGEFVAHVEGSKYLAAHIPGAVYEELDGVDYHPYVGDQDAILDRIQQFLTGTRVTLAADRVLATLLAIDTGERSSERADTVVREQVSRYGGSVADGGSTALAAFDGPGRAIACALAIRDALGATGFGVRIGAHIGEIERGGEVGASALTVTNAVAGRARPGQVLVSRTVADLVAGSGLVLTDAGQHELEGVSVPWQLFAAGEDPAPAQIDVPARDGTFRREGDVWLLTYGGRSVRLRDAKGLSDLAVLLSRPGREVHVAELVGAGDVGPRPSADPRLDASAMAAYRDRLAELAADEEEADRHGDGERAARAVLEREAVVERLAADVGLAGRSRPAEDWAERARKAVRTRIANALKRIEAEHPQLGRHLRASIRTGAFCSYEPPEPVRWNL